MPGLIDAFRLNCAYFAEKYGRNTLGQALDDYANLDPSDPTFIRGLRKVARIYTPERCAVIYDSLTSVQQSVLNVIGAGFHLCNAVSSDEPDEETCSKDVDLILNYRHPAQPVHVQAATEFMVDLVGAIFIQREEKRPSFLGAEILKRIAYSNLELAPVVHDEILTAHFGKTLVAGVTAVRSFITLERPERARWICDRLYPETRTHHAVLGMLAEVIEEVRLRQTPQRPAAMHENVLSRPFRPQ